MIKLEDVYRVGQAPLYLYALLVQREASQNISHQVLPTAAQHLAYFSSRPYAAWYLVKDGDVVVGATYLTKRDEIGIFIFREHRRRGYGREAVQRLMRLHPKEHYLANINPQNTGSQSMFKALGARLIQHTYQL